MSRKKVLILYKKEDYDKVKSFKNFIQNRNLQVFCQSIASGNNYQEIYNYVYGSDFVILFWSPASLKSKCFKQISNRIFRSSIECYSVFHKINKSDFTAEDSHFLSITTWWGSQFKRIYYDSVYKRKPDIVNFAVFAPHQIRAGQGFVIDLWAYLEDQYDTVLKKSKEIKREQIIGRQDSIAIKRNSVLTVRLEMETLNVRTRVNYIYWEGEPASTSFHIRVPENAKIADDIGIAKISFNGIVLAKIIFMVNISETHTDSNYKNFFSRVFKYKTAFASYSSKDSSEVYSRVHGMAKIAPDLDIFLARYSLKSKEKWEEALFEHVPNKDVFYLFWSRNALKSKWVDKEWRIALRERDLSYIDPVPLESPKLATPPPELSALHFDDIWIALKHENDYIDTYPR